LGDFPRVSNLWSTVPCSTCRSGGSNRANKVSKPMVRNAGIFMGFAKKDVGGLDVAMRGCEACRMDVGKATGSSKGNC